MRSSFCPTAFLSLILLTAIQGFTLAEESLKYPQTKRIEHFDLYHGVRVADPYRWLEDDVRTSKEVAQWVAAENKVTMAYLAAIPQRDKIQKRLTELWNFAQYSSPFKEGGGTSISRTMGFRTSPSSIRRTHWTDRPACSWTRISGPRMAQSLSPGWRLARTASTWPTAAPRRGRIGASGTSWTSHRLGPWPTSCAGPSSPAPIGPRIREVSSTRDSRSRRRARSSTALTSTTSSITTASAAPQSEDVLVYARPDHPEWLFGGTVTEDGRYLVITIERGTDPKYRLAVKNLSEPYAMPVDLIDNFDNEYTFVGNDGPVLFFQTDLGAPRRRMVGIDLRRPQRENFREIIPQAAETLLHVGFVGNLFVASYLHNVKPQVKIFSSEGRMFAKCSSRASVRPRDSAASGPTWRPSTPFRASLFRRAFIATTCSAAGARSGGGPR